MVEILAISGSPVEGSSTDLLLETVAESVCDALKGSVETNYRFLKLCDIRFSPCQACGEAPRSGFCLVDDELTPKLDQLARADLVLFGSPIYFDSVSAQAKAFIDRCNCFRPADFDNKDPDHDFLKILTKKRPGAMVLVGGERGWFEGARRVVAGFFKWVEVENCGMIQYHSPDFTRKGSAGRDPVALSEARALGRSLASRLKEAENG